MAKFIVIDGLDGCGKATQVGLLKQKFEEMGKKVVQASFPDYDSNSSEAVKIYLSGKLGADPSELNPYMCSSFFAVDRFIQYHERLKPYFDEEDTVILADRYLSANIIHQGGKIENDIKRYKFVRWVYEYECKLCGLPVEDVTIVLTIPPEVSQGLLDRRYNGDEKKKDIHESDIAYLNSCYDRLKSSIGFAKKIDGVNWEMIDCYDSEKNEIRSIESINELIMRAIHKYVKI